MEQSLQILLDYIQIGCKGRKFAVTGAELASIFGCKQRKIQKQIERLRERKYPIISTDQGDDKGYFYPDGPEDAKEAQKYLRTMRNRALRTLKTVQNIQQGLDKEFGDQMEMEEFKEAS
jgi:biotin operon repressor